MSKGDKIGVAVDGITGPVNVEASQAGRTVEYAFEKDGNVQWIVVQEKTRGGTVVSEHRFPAEHVRWIARHAKEI